MNLSRRQILLAAGASAAAVAIDVAGLDSVASGATQGTVDGTTALADGRGLFGGLTTLDRTVKQPQRQDTQLWTDYVKLVEGPGEAHVVRTDLQPGVYSHPTRAIEAFVQITDLQIVDEKSPGRVEFTDRWADLFVFQNPDVESAYRPHEMLSTQIVESMTQAIRNVHRGPMTGQFLNFAIATGDMVDNVQYNETRWYIDLLDGSHQIVPESGTPGGRDSVSDLFSAVAVHDSAYWSPEGLLGTNAGFDRYRWDYHFPIIHGLLPAARRSFTSTGLGMPWYAAMGNHDGELQGNYPVNPTFAEGVFADLPDISGYPTADRKAYATTWPLPPNPSPAAVSNFVKNFVFRGVVADPAGRRVLTQQQFAAEHFKTTASPAGHGFVKIDVWPGGSIYRTFYSRPALNAPVLYITLDTVCYDGGADGRISADQFDWLEQQLKANSSRYRDLGGAPIANPGVQDRLIVIFAHHTIDSIDNSAPNVIDVGDPDFYYAASVEQLLLRFDNVILYVCGHTHRNDIIPHRRGVTTPLGNHVAGEGGFWEVTTASHIDWPVQSRVFELAKGKGQISIFTTMVDLAAPLDYNGDLSTPVALASLARELAANDPTERPANSNTPANPDGENGRRGHGDDRNLQLLVPAPFFIGAPDDWGSSIAAVPNNLGHLEVLGTKSDDAISWRHGTGADQWADWAVFPAGGLLHAIAGDVNKDGGVELFGANTGDFGRVYRTAQTAPGGSTWSGWTPMGDVNARSIAAARNHDGRMEVFITTAGGDVWTAWQQTPGGAWGNWLTGFGLFSNYVFVQVAAVTNRDGIAVVALNNQGELFIRAQWAAGGAWTNWSPLNNRPTAIFTKIAATLHDDGRIALFAVDHDWRVWRTQQSAAGSGGFGAWALFDEGRTRMTQIAARKDAAKLINVFGVDNTGQVWNRRQTAVNQDTWTQWTALSPTSTLRADVPQVLGSNTQERIITPDLTGLTLAAAKDRLRAAGLQRGTTTSKTSTAPAGTIVSQSPLRPGQVGFEGDTENLVMSTGM